MSLIESVNIPEGQIGKWSVEKFSIGENNLQNMLSGLKHGRSTSPGVYTKLSCKGRGVIMSDVDAEKRDHYGFVRNATGHCLINGLGIGMCLGAALAKDNVEMVTVIESERDVIDLVWQHYASDRCEVVHSCAFDYKPPKGVRYGAVWHDIWDNICSDNLPQMHKLHRKYGRRADWQGSWARGQCERQRNA